MENLIKLLPDSVANQIAAGEVIQRPASVVKELVENAVDAGATSIQIIIKDAGRTLIQVVDNGCGMSVTDARMAFERHATSKIRKADDLFTLHTMGFRGEALPSIAAVSDIDLRTMRRDDATGTRLLISASKVVDQTPEACVPGTNMMVKRLFFNLPARRKFLKKDSVELSHIVREFERLTLINANIEFSLTHNDVILHKLAPGSLKQRISQLFGKTFDHQLIPIETETSLVRINGFVSLPENSRRRNALQFFFVNGRYMRHPYFHKAVIKCYEDLIPSDAQPNYFINFVVDAETIDVNIHPQKYEIKFENEQPVWQILVAAIKESLGRFNVSRALDFDSVDVPEIPPFNPATDMQQAPDDVDPEFNPFAESPMRQQSPATDWEKLYESFTAKSVENPDHMRGSAMNSRASSAAGARLSADKSIIESPSLIDADDFASDSVRDNVFQLNGRYIITSAKAGLMVIDQHRAHTLILYDKYIDMINRGDVPSQRLIFPDCITLDPVQDVIVGTIDELLISMGFDISNLGNNSWSINAVPAILGNVSASQALLDIITAVADDDDDVRQSQWQKVALAMANAAAIKYGASLKKAEIDSLVAELFSLSTPAYTPDGKRVFVTVEMPALNAMF